MIKRGLNWLFCCRGGASTFYKLAVIDALLAHLAMVLFIFLCVWKKDGRTYYPRPHTPLMTRRSTATVEASHASLSASERGRDIPRLFSVVGAFPRFFLSVITSLNFQIFFCLYIPLNDKKKEVVQITKYCVLINTGQYELNISIAIYTQHCLCIVLLKLCTVAFLFLYR